MHSSRMRSSAPVRWMRAGLILGLALLALSGCRKFTRERFEIIQQGVDDRDDVRHVLGKPQFKAGDVWHYEDIDRHVNAQIWFGDDGRVNSKQWMDARTGAWEGRSPGAPEPPPGEVREQRLRTRRIDD